MENDKTTLTHSAISMFDTCPRSYQFRHIYHIAPERDTEALFIGKLVHEAIEMHLQGKSIDEVHNNLTKICVVPPNDGTVEAEEQIKQLKYIISKAAAIITAYYIHWGDNQLTVHETEQTFSVPLQRVTDKGNIGTSRKYELKGVRDAIVSRDNKTLLMEHKTTSNKIDEPIYWQRLNVDNQITLYWKAAQKDGYNIKAVLYNVISKPLLQPKTTVPVLDDEGLKIVVDQDGERVLKKNGDPRQTADKNNGYELKVRDESPEEFFQRVLQTMLAEPDKFFSRREIARLESDLTAGERDIWYSANLINQCIANNYFPRSTTACMKWGKPCPYLDICSTGGFNEGDPLPAGYEYRSPHEELETE